MFLFNSLNQKKEKFVPINPPQVGMYICGPTVYDYQHIGNFRTMVLSDILHRVLEVNGYKVKAVRNVTDIDDKIIRNASEQGIPIDEYTQKYTDIYFKDLERLNVLPVDENPKATENIKQMTEYVQDLIQKGFAYVEGDGSVYFDISKFENYGDLTGVKERELKSGTRILSDEYTKDNVQDFALWKATKEGEIASYDSPWGKGRPGWHIECSVMSQRFLGDTFDIHVGGKDLTFPHHENEIAQSEAKTGKKFVNYWIHGEMLLVDGTKMSKSLGNFYLVKDLVEKDFSPLALRYFYLTAHYRKPLNFTWEALAAAQTALNKVCFQLTALKTQGRTTLSREKSQKVDEFGARFLAAVNDDLNMPQALAIFWEVFKSNLPGEDKYDLMLSFDEVLGLGLAQVPSTKLQIPDNVQTLIKKRDKLRDEGKFTEADKIREEIEKAGFSVQDAPVK
jgi:cysteinyl-tRNA synthetase